VLDLLEGGFGEREECVDVNAEVAIAEGLANVRIVNGGI
jgi:hypothetical protein